MLAAVTFFCLGSVFYAYFGYPLLLIILTRLGAERRGCLTSAGGPDGELLTIIIAARNEESVIGEKIEQTLGLKLGTGTVESAGTQVIVCSDASDDRTDEIVRSFSARGVELVRSSAREGKEKAQALAVSAARGRILLFTDAKIRLNAGAIDSVLSQFEDQGIGAVSSRDLVEPPASASGGPAEVQGSGEGFYVRYEMWLRKVETAFDSVVGLSGSAFAVRRKLGEGMRTDLPSDFALLISARRAGLRGVLDSGFVGSYCAVKTEEEEFSRKVRTVLRGITTLMASAETMNPLIYGTFAFQMISHKLFRWLVPWFLLVGYGGTLELASGSAVFALLAAGLSLFFLAAVAAFFWPKLRSKVLFKIPLFFCVTNLAVLIAWIKYLSGQRAVTWNPSAKAA